LKDWKTINNFYNFVKVQNFDKDFFLKNAKGSTKVAVGETYGTEIRGITNPKGFNIKCINGLTLF